MIKELHPLVYPALFVSRGGVDIETLHLPDEAVRSRRLCLPIVGSGTFVRFAGTVVIPMFKGFDNRLTITGHVTGLRWVYFFDAAYFRQFIATPCPFWPLEFRLLPSSSRVFVPL